MIVDCAHYQDGSRQHEGPLPIAEAARRCDEGVGDNGFVWVGLHDPEPDELREVAERFALPALAVEDAMQTHQRTKVADYENGYFMVLHSARYLDDVEEVEFGEIHVFTGARYVIVLRHGDVGELSSARKRLEQRPELLRQGPAAAVWAVMDKIVGDYAPVVEGLENDIEEVEEAVFDESGDQTRRIYFLRRELAKFWRAVHPLLIGLEAFEGDAAARPLAPVLREHLRDVFDHLRHVEEEIVTQRELLSSILQANLAVIAVAQNDIVRRISGWAAIITVPTLVASIYGMNFDHMPELHWRLGYPAVLAGMLVSGAVLHRLLRRAGWL